MFDTEGELAKQISELIAWKKRQEADQADRLIEMHNAIVDVFSEKHATVTEIQTVLELVKAELTGKFIKQKKVESMALASQAVPTAITGSKKKEYPAKINGE